MRNNHRKESGLWAIALFISGILATYQLALADIAQQLSQHASLSDHFSAFVYPNPVQARQQPTLVVQPGSAERISARIYDPAGTEIFQTRVDDHSLSASNQGLAYEIPVKNNLKPGVYMGLLLGYQGDRISERSTFRFSVVK